MKLCDIKDGTIYGKLLLEAEKDFGVKAGDVLPLAFLEDEEDGV